MTDTLLGAGSVTGSDLGCADVVVSVTDWPSLVSPPDWALATGCFGFFGAVAAVDVSEPDFLSLTVAVVVDFLLPVLPLPSDSSLPAELPLLSPPASAPSSPDVPEDWDDSVEADDEGDCVSVPADDEDEPVDEVDESDEDEVELEDDDDESDDELVDPESDGSAHATPGAVATATPTPKATAKPPTRPTYFAYPITTTSQSGRETAASAARTSSTAHALRD